MNTRNPSSVSGISPVLIVALPLLLAACSQAPRPPLATTVCELPAHAEVTVRIDAVVSVDSEGNAKISGVACPATRIDLRLSQSASRAGAAALLQSAAHKAVDAGKSSFPVTLTGVYTSGAESVFVAESVSTPPSA